MNPAQEKAVVSKKNRVIVLSGPGSGKTRVITHRVLFLLQQEKIPPETVIVTTFTNKAAAEMKERLYKMAPHDIASIDKLILGTFHHIGALYLRKYGTVVGLKNNFQVLDSEDSKKILNMVVKEHFPMAATLKVNFGSIISNAKAQNWTEKDIEATYGDGDPLKQLAVGVFREYNRELRRTNSVDFDDLLVFTLMLFQVWPHLSSSIKHVIIDEFQDTNAIQYMLMERFASVCQKFTVVCDPDQSIYAWRNADVTNLIKFQEKFKEDSESIFLEQNYRSTKSIISASLSVIREDKERVDKGLWTENWEGTSVVMQEFQNGRQQAEMIARNIEMLHDSSAGVLNYNDFAVLYRTNKEGNALQQALLMKNLPFRVRGGVSFFDRKEIKDLLCYIKFANNPYDFFSFDRIINVPPRGVGAATIKQLVDGYNSDESSLYEHVRSRAKGKTKIIKFMNMIKEVQSMIKNNCTLEEILLYCLESLEYVAYVRTLDKSQKKKTVISATETEDETNREKNIEELIAFLKDFESGFRGSEIETHFRMLQEEDKTVTELDPSTLPQELSTTKLVETLFEKVTLDAAPDALKSDRKKEPKISLMTLHTSKGLEFPFVWILNVRYGCIPHKLNPKIAEERRLLYVGMTRAQCSLVLAFNHEKLGYYDDSDAFWSPFVGVLLQKREDVRVESRGDTLMVRMKVDDFVHIAKQLRRTFDVAELKKKSMDLEDLQKLQGFNEKSTGKDTNEGSYKHKGTMKSSGMQTSLKDYFTFKSLSKKGTPSSEIKRESTITPMPAKAMPPKQSNDKSSVLNSIAVDTIKKMQNADASAGFNYFQRQKQPKRNYEQVLLDGDEDMKQHQLFREEKGKSNCAGYEEVKLSDEQQHVLDLVVNQGKSVFFTGNAGAGKSFLLREIIKQLKRIKSGEALQICASTGIAACNIGGKTLHSFVGCGIVRMHPSQMAGRVIKNKSALARWQITEVLIIDEISMIDGDLFDSIDQCARIVRDSKKPFGGIQLVICGDFFQLPPVPERDSNGKMIAPTFCFETESWKNAIEETVMLTHTFRQTDPVFINILNELRFNKLSAESIKVLKSLNRPVKIGDFSPIELYPTRREVENANIYKLKSLKEETHKYETTDWFKSGAVETVKRLKKALDGQCQAPFMLELKKGAQVMLLKNLDHNIGLFNGTLGIVAGFDSSDSPIVAFKVAGSPHPVQIAVKQDDWDILENGKRVAVRSQIPLILAWAMSIHKAQGQTIPVLKLDLSRSFEAGQVHVALSRAVSLETVEMKGFHPAKVQVNAKVAEFCATLKTIENSNQVENDKSSVEEEDDCEIIVLD